MVGASEFAGTERFELKSRLGAGGMGTVFEALDRQQGVRVALKTLRTLGGDALMRFKREFRALADLHHPNLITLGELHEAAGQWFFTMELLGDGQDFVAWVRPGCTRDPGNPSPWSETVRGGRGKDGEGWRPAPPLGGRLDEGRLRAALAQLTEALNALHTAGKVHRDIKPSNILITPDGTLKVLDFGLVRDLLEREHSTQVVGTTDYMAPEQAASRPLGPEADWYAVGVMLYEALTGVLPFDGPPLAVLQRKQVETPPPPTQLAPGAPADLAAACMELLVPDPAARLRPRELSRRLGLGGQPARPRTISSQSPLYVGRARELRELREAFEQVSRGACLAVCVHGESGVGKSALVKRFVELALAEDARVVSLSGRCYERESVPYKGIDGVVDALASHLGKTAKLDAAAVLPRHVGLLAQVFPVLLRAEAVAQAPGSQRDEQLDPQEHRRRVFVALRELLARLGERRPLCVVIDDLQWADADSLALLGALLEPPDAPQLLLVATLRGAQAAATVARLPGEVRQLTVGPLADDEARELASSLLRKAGLPPTLAPRIAAEAAGHALFIDELVRHAGEAGHAIGLRLEDALGERIGRLAEPARRILELISVAGLPQPQGVIAAAHGDSDFPQQLGVLRAANLARSGGTREQDLVETYHDRVRDATLARLSPEARSDCHRRLALALERTQDAEGLAVHWLGAREPGRAAVHAEVAGRRAAEALAFERAARWLASALELELAGGGDGGGGGDEGVVRRLRLALGDAWVSAGRGVKAADVLLAAAQGATAAQALDLRRRAAEQLLRSGHVDRGVAALESVLGAVGMQLPRSTRSALVALVLRRAQLRLRGLGFKERDPTQIAAEELTRVDVCWSAASGLAMVDTVRGADFQTRNLLLALRAGEPKRIARALAMEASFLASSAPDSRRVLALLARASELAQRLRDPHTTAIVLMTTGAVQFLNTAWAPARDMCGRATEMLRSRTVGTSWEIASAELFRLWTLFFLGELREMSRRVFALLRESEGRGDLYAATGYRTGLANAAWLMSNDVAGARHQLRDAARAWSHAGFHFQHYWNMLAQMHIDLYVGDGAGAYKRWMERWPAFEQSFFPRIRVLGIEAWTVRGCAALAAATATPAGSAREALISSAERDADRAAARGTGYGRGMTELVRAGAQAARGRDARPALGAAIAALDGAAMALHAAAARRRLGEIVGGDEGAALIASCDGYLGEQKVTNPRRLVAMLTPGFPD